MSHYVGALPNEIFVGNTNAEGGITVHLRVLKTIRLGEQALDIEGKRLDPDHMLPLFIHQSEVEAHDRIMMRRAFPNQFR